MRPVSWRLLLTTSARASFTRFLVIGILAKHSSLVKDSLRLAGETEHAIQDVSSSSFLVNGKLRILLLSKEDGKPHVARVARGIAKAVNAGFVSRDEVDVDYVQEKLYCESLKDRALIVIRASC
jgi:undecaprenyl pyrophosphate synthase